MSELQENTKNRGPKRKFSPQEKQGYCLSWEKSGLSQAKFSKINDISKSAFYKWYRDFKKNIGAPGFAPLTVGKNIVDPEAKKEFLQLSISFPNGIELSVAMPAHHVIPFIQELNYAATVIR